MHVWCIARWYIVSLTIDMYIVFKLMMDVCMSWMEFNLMHDYIEQTI